VPISFQPVTLDVNHGDEAAMLVFRDERLSAIVTRLGAEHGGLAGRWFVETLFTENAGMLHVTLSSLTDLEWLLARS